MNNGRKLNSHHTVMRTQVYHIWVIPHPPLPISPLLLMTVLPLLSHSTDNRIYHYSSIYDIGQLPVLCHGGSQRHWVCRRGAADKAEGCPPRIRKADLWECHYRFTGGGGAGPAFYIHEMRLGVWVPQHYWEWSSQLLLHAHACKLVAWTGLSFWSKSWYSPFSLRSSANQRLCTAFPTEEEILTHDIIVRLNYD